MSPIVGISAKEFHLHVILGCNFGIEVALALELGGFPSFTVESNIIQIYGKLADYWIIWHLGCFLFKALFL